MGAAGAGGLRPPLDLRLSILGPHSCSLGSLGIAAICIPPGCSGAPRVGTAALGRSGPPWDRAGQGTPEPAGRRGIEGSSPGRRCWEGAAGPDSAAAEGRVSVRVYAQSSVCSVPFRKTTNLCDLFRIRH